MYKIAPSILSADITRIGEEVDAVMKAGSDLIHFDVMDNHYVPNLTFGPALCEALAKRFPNLPIDVHLMTMPVDELIVQFADAGAKRIAIHPDATIHLDRSLRLIKAKGCAAGLALNPSNGIESVKWCLHHLAYVLVMTVNPGFGGQTLIPEMLGKIRELRQAYPNLPVCVDGGVAVHNIAEIAKAGATEFVAGAAVFKSTDYKKQIMLMREQLSC